MVPLLKFYFNEEVRASAAQVGVVGGLACLVAWWRG
jgi:hypothetical protein